MPEDFQPQPYNSNNQIESSAMGRISSLKDEENLNQRWIDLLKLGNTGHNFEGMLAKNERDSRGVQGGVRALNTDLNTVLDDQNANRNHT